MTGTPSRVSTALSRLPEHGKAALAASSRAAHRAGPVLVAAYEHAEYFVGTKVLPAWRSVGAVAIAYLFPLLLIPSFSLPQSLGALGGLITFVFVVLTVAAFFTTRGDPRVVRVSDVARIWGLFFLTLLTTAVRSNIAVLTDTKKQRLGSTVVKALAFSATGIGASIAAAFRSLAQNIQNHTPAMKPVFIILTMGFPCLCVWNAVWLIVVMKGTR